MKLRLANVGKDDLIIQSNAQGNRRLRPLSWWETFRKRFVEIDIGDNEVVVVRTTKTVEPDTGTPIRTPV